MQRVASARRMPWSRVRVAIRRGRAYRFISWFFIAPTTPLTHLVYDSDADTLSRQSKSFSHQRSCWTRWASHNEIFMSLSIILFLNIYSKYRTRLIRCILGQYWIFVTFKCVTIANSYSLISLSFSKRLFVFRNVIARTRKEIIINYD